MISLAEQCDQRAAEFQGGKPPAGEAGMLVVTCNWNSSTFYFQFWDGAMLGGTGLFPAHARVAAEKRDTEGAALEANERYRFATLPELLAAGLTEAEALPMLHKSMLPEAAQGDEWGPWVKGKWDKCPLPPDTNGRRVQAKNCYGREIDADLNSLDVMGWAWGQIPAYRLKRTAKPPQAPAELWYPPVPAGFGPWVEHTGDSQPIDDGAFCCVLLVDHRRDREWPGDDQRTAYRWDWDDDLGDSSIVAYCTRIEATTPIHEEDEEDGGELDIGAILEGLRKHFGGEAFAAAARPFKPKPGQLWERDAVNAVNAALQAREQTLKAQHAAMLRRDYE